MGVYEVCDKNLSPAWDRIKGWVTLENSWSRILRVRFTIGSLSIEVLTRDNETRNWRTDSLYLTDSELKSINEILAGKEVEH